LSNAKRNRVLDDATTEPSKTDDIMTNNNYSFPTDVHKEIRYSNYAEQEEQIDKILDGKKNDDDEDDAFDMFADDDKHKIDKLQAKILQIRQGPATLTRLEIFQFHFFMMMENYQSSEKKMISHQTSEKKSMSVHNNNSFIKPESTQKNAHSTHLRTLRPPRSLRSQSTHCTGTLKPIYVP
jgi:hypothetical protein